MNSFLSAGELTKAFEAIQVKVDDRINQIAEAFLADLDMDIPPEVEETFKAATAGGKRFRAFAAVSGAAIGQTCIDEGGETHLKEEPPCGETSTPAAAVSLLQAGEKPSVLDLAAALEFFQGAALVHDDIIDRSDTRRGRPTAHVAMAGHHRKEEFLGDDEAFGSDSAILVGDLLLAAAEFALASATSAMSPHRGSALLRQIGRASCRERV